MTDPNEEMTVLPTLMNYRDTAAHAFVPPKVESIAAAGRRRRQRTGVITATAVVAIGVASAVVMAGLPRDGAPVAGGTPSPSATATTVDPHGNATPPSPSPSAPGNTTPPAARTQIPPSVMLQPEDLGPGYKADDSPIEGDWELYGINVICRGFEYQPYPGPTTGPAVPKRERTLDGPKDVLQRMVVDDEAEAKWEIQQVRAIVAACGDLLVDGERVTLEVVGSGFAGEHSILIKGVAYGGKVHYHAFVYKAGLFTELASWNGFNAEQMKAIAVKAAARM